MITAEIDLETHPATIRLMSEVGCSLNEAIGMIVRLWMWCDKHSDNGLLAEMPDKPWRQILNGYENIDELTLARCGIATIQESGIPALAGWEEKTHRPIRRAASSKHRQKRYRERMAKREKEALEEKVGPSLELRKQRGMRRISEEWMKAYNECRGTLPKATGLTLPREKHIGARIRYGWTVESLKVATTKLAASDFARGGSWANFNWLIKSDDNLLKATEGNYDNRPDPKKESIMVGENTVARSLQFAKVPIRRENGKEKALDMKEKGERIPCPSCGEPGKSLILEVKATHVLAEKCQECMKPKGLMKCR